MAIVINGSGTVTGLAVGGLPDGTVDAGTLATNSVDSAELIDGAVDDSHMAAMAASKLTGALPAISGASLTNLPSKGKNIFINGDMGVAQRGTITGITSSKYTTCDRWNLNYGDAGTWTTTQDTDVPAGQGFSHSLKFDCTSADTSVASGSFLRLHYRPESQDLKQCRWGTSNAQPLVMSFWIKFDNLTGDFCTDVLSLDNSNNRTVSQKFTYSTAGAWQKCVFTIPADTGGNTLGVDNAGDTYFQIFLQAGSDLTSGTLNTTWATRVNANRAAGQTIQAASSTSNNVYLTGCQLELGSTATDFEYRTYGEQLALCQRYFERFAKVSSETVICLAQGTSSTLVFGRLPFSTEKRVEPSGSVSSAGHIQVLTGAASAWNTPTGVSINAGNKKCMRLGISGLSGMQAGGCHEVRINDSNGYIDFDAEL